MIAIADAGPLLALAKVNALGLLPQLYQQVITPPTVFTEAVTAGLAQNAPDALLLNAAFTSDQLQVRVPTLTSLPVPFPVHQGEGESICRNTWRHPMLLLQRQRQARQRLSS